jgi:glucuronoarabinoxylan endo-1,4-beta-xylanase
MGTNSNRSKAHACLSVVSLATFSFSAVSLWSGGAAAQAVTIDLSDVRQVIDGFGGSSAFFGSEIPPDDAEWLFSAEEGIGLSLHRVMVDVDPEGGASPVAYTPELETARQAYDFGARIWATSWTPPVAWKTNGEKYASPGDGRLKTANYGDFANYLADFVERMDGEGVPLVAISPQNEPDWNATWDGCLWSPAEMVNFVRDHLGPEFEQRNLSTMIAAPDTAFLRELPSFLTAFEADAEALSYLGVVATHPYSTEGFTADDLAGMKAAGKPIWQTEISWEAQNAGTTNDTPDSPPSMRTALWMVNLLHDHLTQYEMNAWNYWGVVHSGEFDLSGTDAQRQNPAFIQGGVRFKRGYAMGNYSKFVRPGFHRVTTTPATNGDVRISAYVAEERIVVVAINAGQAAVERTLTLQGLDALGAIAEAVPWITSGQLSLEAQAPVAVTNSAFSYSLPGQSVTSFVIEVDRAALPVGSDGGSPTASADAGVSPSGSGEAVPSTSAGAAGSAPAGSAPAGTAPLATTMPTALTTSASSATDPGVASSGSAAPPGVASSSVTPATSTSASTGGASSASGAPTASGSVGVPTVGVGVGNGDEVAACSCRVVGRPVGGTAAWLLLGLFGTGVAARARRTRIR